VRLIVRPTRGAGIGAPVRVRFCEPIANRNGEGTVLLTLCKGKLHRAIVTQAELHYVGSITIAADLLRAAGIVPWEKVQVVDVANGARFETYALEGAEGSGTVCVNGAAARLVQVGDPVIIIAYAQLTPEEARSFRPALVLLGPDNTVRQVLPHATAADLAQHPELTEE
jgi:aspartate 1-decarboxylase